MNVKTLTETFFHKVEMGDLSKNRLLSEAKSLAEMKDVTLRAPTPPIKVR